MTPGDALQFVGCRVQKHSGKPFKSTFITATVAGAVYSPYPGRSDRVAFVFEEDDSIVECNLLDFAII